MQLLTPCRLQVYPAHRGSRPLTAGIEAVKRPLPPVDKEKNKTDKERSRPPAERDTDDGGVIGEVEQPAPPTDKPEASRPRCRRKAAEIGRSTAV